MLDYKRALKDLPRVKHFPAHFTGQYQSYSPGECQGGAKVQSHPEAGPAKVLPDRISCYSRQHVLRHNFLNNLLTELKC